MKSIKKLGLLALFFTVEIVAMEQQEEVRFYDNAWEQDLDNLSNNKNWNDNGFLTHKWIDSAVEDALELLENSTKTMRALEYELHDRLTELDKVKNPHTGKKMIASTFNQTLQVIDDFAVVNDFKKALKAKITPEMQAKLEQQKKLREQNKQEQWQQRKLKRQEQQNQKSQQEFKQMQDMQAAWKQEKEAEVSHYGIQEKSANELQRADEYLQQQKKERQEKIEQDRFVQQRARQQKNEHEEMKKTRQTIKQKIVTQSVQQEERKLSLIERFWRWLGYPSEQRIAQREQKSKEREQKEQRRRELEQRE